MFSKFINLFKLKGLYSFLFISLFAILLMCILLFMHKKSTSSITELQRGNELAGKTFQINNALQEVVSGIYTAENSFRSSIQKDDKKDTLESHIAIAKMQENANLLQALFNADNKSKSVNQFTSLIATKISLLNQILAAWPNKELAKNLLYSTKNNTINDNIYELAITIQLEAEMELQKKINQNFAASHQALSLSKWFTLLALSAILLLGTIIILHLRRNNKLIKDLGLAKFNADKAASIKEQFLANMSHEIRTPVNSIVGFTNLLQKTSLLNDQEQFVTHIKTSGENLLNIVNDILDISKMEAGMLHFQNQPFNLPELCYYIEMMFYNERQRKNINFKCIIANDVPEALIGDDERLKQILANLISNAYKFTEDGSIHLTVNLLSKTATSAVLSFAVKDSGIGIAKEKLDTIFERFEQANTETSKIYGGTGLGLSIVKKLVTMQGGEISVTSIADKGSEFVFTLPLMLYSEQEEYANYTKEASKNIVDSEFILAENHKILAVEDNKMNQLLLQYLFKQWNANYVLANNGEEAIQYLQKQTFDIVLLDIQMPILNGYATAKWIREEFKSNIPIVAMTAFVLQGEKDKCFEHGMNEYLPKPINEAKLKQLLSKYLHLPKDAFFTNGLQEKKAIQQFDNNTHINVDYLNEIFSGNTEFISNILELFIKQYPKDLGLLGEAVKTKDVKQVKALAHNLKSTTTSVNDQFPQLNNLQSLEELSVEHTDWNMAESELSGLLQSEQTVLSEATNVLKDIC